MNLVKKLSTMDIKKIDHKRICLHLFSKNELIFVPKRIFKHNSLQNI
jgi:hypothetical protein